jgi:6-pyruvoyltetrahydropterin/6-carboxytetrahydropterin synthase
MFSVGVSDHCMVAHSLADPVFGPAQRLHGATYTVEVEVHASALGGHDVVMDLGALRMIVRGALAPVDYSNLDEHPAFQGRLSTTERLAVYLAEVIADAIAALPEDARPVEPASLRVRLRESPNAWAGCQRPIP